MPVTYNICTLLDNTGLGMETLFIPLPFFPLLFALLLGVPMYLLSLLHSIPLQAVLCLAARLLGTDALLTVVELILGLPSQLQPPMLSMPPV